MRDGGEHQPREAGVALGVGGGGAEDGEPGLAQIEVAAEQDEAIGVRLAHDVAILVDERGGAALAVPERVEGHHHDSGMEEGEVAPQAADHLPAAVARHAGVVGARPERPLQHRREGRIGRHRHHILRDHGASIDGPGQPVAVGEVHRQGLAASKPDSRRGEGLEIDTIGDDSNIG